ncbi:MAG: zinc ribbon domain-containing protein [Armatimonadetes bacterium]|nr:zinc ribbon domain-containing protein [Armatimonadota bacterium]
MHHTRPSGGTRFEGNRTLGAVLFSFWVISFTALTVSSVSHYGDFKTRMRTVSTEDGSSNEGGFVPGETALFGVAAACLGIGLLLSLTPLSARRRGDVALVMAVIWHAFGIWTRSRYIALAPRPMDTRPFVALGIFHWLGLVPTAVGVPESLWQGRLRSTIWHLMGGCLLGGILGGLAGAVAVGVRAAVLVHQGVPRAGGDWWFSGLAGGTGAGGMLFVLYRLTAGAERWRLPSRLVAKEPAPAAEAPAPTTLCRSCGREVPAGTAKCPGCGARVRARRRPIVGDVLSAFGLALFASGVYHEYLGWLARRFAPGAADAILEVLAGTGLGTQGALVVLGLVLLGIGSMVGTKGPPAKGS